MDEKKIRSFSKENLIKKVFSLENARKYIWRKYFITRDKYLAMKYPKLFEKEKEESKEINEFYELKMLVEFLSKNSKISCPKCEKNFSTASRKIKETLGHLAHKQCGHVYCKECHEKHVECVECS